MGCDDPVNGVFKKGETKVNPEIVDVSKNGEANRHHDAWKQKRDSNQGSDCLLPRE
jgi:hypothetical protein